MTSPQALAGLRPIPEGMLLLVGLACGEHDPVLVAGAARPLTDLTDLTDLTERYISIRPRSEPLPHVLAAAWSGR